ncbi:MAG: T9SS type A sorting domain-containing protein [Saprospiraceae bacterium]|nr:T9SS type A sorting domain-containing protein [Saprospiraceae bacterium]
MNRIFFTLLLVTLTFGAFAQINLEEGLVAYYPITNNQIADSSEFENNPVDSTLSVGFTNGRNDDAGGALGFNGDNQFVEFPSVEHINFNGEGAYTISFWVKAPENQVNTAGTINDILLKWDNNGPVPYPFSVRIRNQNDENNGTITAGIYDSNQSDCFSNGNALNSGTAVNDDQWHHIIFARTEAGFIQLYIDCVLEAQTFDNSICSLANESTLRIGARTPEYFRAFTGAIDDVRIYNRELNEDEICTLTSTEELFFEDAAISLFPNPLKRGDNLQVSLPDQSFVEQITVYSLGGKYIGRFQNQTAVHLPAGVYILQITLENSTQTIRKKLVVVE